MGTCGGSYQRPKHTMNRKRDELAHEKGRKQLKSFKKWAIEDATRHHWRCRDCGREWEYNPSARFGKKRVESGLYGW